MKKKFSVAGLVFVAICTIAATIQWYSDQPSITTLEDSMVLAVERATPKGYRSITLASLRDYALNNVSITNYTIYSTNFWISNSYVSNYVVTNVYNDTYASNFFLTQNYVTNQYSTNVTITNWYAPDTYVSNFFNTNIYVNDTYVSNFFSTNIYNTVVTNVYDYLYVSNAFITNITAQKLTVQNIYANNGTFTNGITNLALTPNTIVKSDANRALASVPNGTGSLTNDGSGNFGWSAVSDGDQVWTNDLEYGTKLINYTNRLVLGTNTPAFTFPSAQFLLIEGTIPDGAYNGVEMILYTEGADTAYETKSGIYLQLKEGVTTNNSGTAGIALVNETVPSSYNEGVWVASYSAAGIYSTESPTVNHPWGLQESIAGYSLRATPLSIGVMGAASDRNATITFPGTNIGGAFGADRSTYDSTLVGAYVRVADGGLSNTDVYQDAGVLIENDTTNAVPFIIARTNHANVIGKLTKDGIWQANAYLTTEQSWSGPTNQISVGEWTYTANTPCAVTNIVQYAAGVGNGALLSITNASSSNITFTVHSPIQIPYGETSRSYTITNGNTFFGSFRKGAHGSVFVPRGFYNP